MIKSKIKDILKNKDNYKTIAIYVFLPIILNLLIEMFSRMSPVSGFKYMFTHPIPFLCNSFIILAVLSITLLVRRRAFALAALSAIWIACGVTNMFLLSSRVTPFNASDLKLIDSAITIMNKYFSNAMVGVVIIGVIALVSLIVFIFLIPEKKEK